MRSLTRSLAGLCLLVAVAEFPSAAATTPTRMFFSGHSLLAAPIPEFTQAIARSQGSNVLWNQQNIDGSTIRLRSGGAEGAVAWSGYRTGANREGRDLDVVAELKSGASVGGRYDTLLITEMHALLDALKWGESVRYLRHFHERFIAGSPSGSTWFYESWLDVSDKADPRRWIAYERDASRVWGCIATRVNASLAHERRSDRIRSLRAGLALAYLVERATQSPGVPGLTQGQALKTVDSLIQDQVHLTPLGSYYMALVIDATVFERNPVGSWAPEGVGPELARSLQKVAAEFVQSQSIVVPMSLEDCGAFIRNDFVTRYWTYLREARKNEWGGAIRAHGRWALNLAKWHFNIRFRPGAEQLRFDPATDGSYWLPPP